MEIEDLERERRRSSTFTALSMLADTQIRQGSSGVTREVPE